MAQEVVGSSPIFHPCAFSRRPHRLAVRTQDFHSCNRGSIPLGVINGASAPLIFCAGARGQAGHGVPGTLCSGGASLSASAGGTFDFRSYIRLSCNSGHKTRNFPRPLASGRNALKLPALSLQQGASAFRHFPESGTPRQLPSTGGNALKLPRLSLPQKLPRSWTVSVPQHETASSRMMFSEHSPALRRASARD